MTQADIYELSALAVSTDSIIFWARGHGGDLQPLLMPVHPSILARH